jgi:hypothetical protein
VGETKCVSVRACVFRVDVHVWLYVSACVAECECVCVCMCVNV